MGKRNHRGKKAGIVGGRKGKPGSKENPILVPKSTEPITDKTTRCPTCGGQVMVKKQGPDHQIQAKGTMEIWSNLPEEIPEVRAKLREVRAGKNTVCILGTSPDNCNQAPWGDGLDMWGVNDGHRLPYLEPHWKEITGWWQMHHRWRWMLSKEIPGSERMRYGGQHYAFLTDPNMTFPIWMQRHYEDVPRSVEYPLKEITEYALYKKIQRGLYWQRKYYTCSFAYMAGLILWSQTQQGLDFLKMNKPYERVEMYGVQLKQEIEYIMQKPSTEFWVGLLIGRGIEVYVPGNGSLLSGEAYGYRNPHGNPSLAQIDEENIGYWDWGDGVPDWGFRDKITWG